MIVLYEDDQLLVVHKPPGVLAQPDRTGDADVLTKGKRYVAGEADSGPFLGLVHRLDRPTSGVMVLARTSAAARSLSAQFRERTAQKEYLAVVERRLRGIGEWHDYVAKIGRQPQIVPSEHPEGKRAELHWQALYPGEGRTLLKIQLHTGRPHQIRLQAAERGHPVVGDGRYGASTSWTEGRIALHHAVLRVEHPARSTRETFVADVPEPWRDRLSDEMTEAVERVLSRARPRR